MRLVLRFVLLRLVWPAVYCAGCLRRIDPRLIIFACDTGGTLADNFLPIYGRLRAEGYDCVFFPIRIQGHNSARRQLRIVKFLLLYARARAVFLTEHVNPVNACRPRKGTAVVQLWHGCGAFKKWGYLTEELAWGPGRRAAKWLPFHRNYTHVPVSAPEVVPHHAAAYRCNGGRVQPWGVPRTDFYFRPGVAQACRELVLEALPGIGERKIVLYAPTFRGDSVAQSRHDDVLDYAAMEEALGGSCALLLRPHPKARKTIAPPEQGQAPFVFDAANLPIEQLLCAADLLVSDYSSLIYEYALLGRPMLFFAYDLEDYEAARSFCYPYLRHVPGDLAWDTDDLVRGIQGNLFGDAFDPARVETFRLKFMSACDGHSTERIIQKVLGV